MTDELMLQMVAIAGSVGHLKDLLDQGADPNQKLNGGATALHFAAEYGQTPLVPMLVEKGADVHAKETKSGDTPLHAAALWQQLGAAEALLKHGADPNMPNKNGATPSTLAFIREDYPMMSLMRQYGGNPHRVAARRKAGDEPQRHDL